jgi:hypothetical protein
MALFAPMPRANDSTAAVVNAGLRVRLRQMKRRLFKEGGTMSSYTNL